MVSFTRREQIVILLLVIGIIIVVGYNIISKDSMEINKSDNDNYDIEDLTSFKTDNTDFEDDVNEEEQYIVVDICGQVNNPGVVKLEKGSRVIDAVEKAGGLTEDADRVRINLAKKLEDENKIYIPKIEEQTEYNDSIEESIWNQDNQGQDNDKVNINTASKEELESLPGIGSVLAQRIIQYRKNKEFNTINEIVNVSGIGEKKFDSIEDLIIVE